VHDAANMSIVERIGDFAHDSSHISKGNGAAAAHAIANALSFD
jgi:hypothetical protein